MALAQACLHASQHAACSLRPVRTHTQQQRQGGCQHSRSSAQQACRNGRCGRAHRTTRSSRISHVSAAAAAGQRRRPRPAAAFGHGVTGLRWRVVARQHADSQRRGCAACHASGRQAPAVLHQQLQQVARGVCEQACGTRHRRGGRGGGCGPTVGSSVRETGPRAHARAQAAAAASPPCTCPPLQRLPCTQIVSSSFTAAAYLQSAGFAGSGKRALLLGSSGMADELRAAGIAVVDAAALQLPLLDSVDAMLQLQVRRGCACIMGLRRGNAPARARALTSDSAPVPACDAVLLLTQLDERIGAVVLGWDAAFSYSRLVYACACLRELPGCIFVASNLDHADRIGDGQRLMPGTGALVAALATAAGMQPVCAAGLLPACGHPARVCCSQRSAHTAQACQQNTRCRARSAACRWIAARAAPGCFHS